MFGRKTFFQIFTNNFVVKFVHVQLSLSSASSALVSVTGAAVGVLAFVQSAIAKEG